MKNLNSNNNNNNNNEVPEWQLSMASMLQSHLKNVTSPIMAKPIERAIEKLITECLTDIPANTPIGETTLETLIFNVIISGRAGCIYPKHEGIVTVFSQLRDQLAPFKPFGKRQMKVIGSWASVTEIAAIAGKFGYFPAKATSKDLDGDEVPAVDAGQVIFKLVKE